MIRTSSLLALALFASLANAQGTLLQHFKGAQPADRLGWSLAAPGDLDGDGLSELVIGVPFDPVDTVQKGSLQVRSGSGPLLYTLWGDAALDHAGWSLAALGDLDLDGRGDFAFGLPDSDLAAPDAGLARVVSGATGSPLFAFFGSSPGESFGHALASAGDVDGDARADLLIGAYRAASLGAFTGRVEVRSGASGALLRTHAGSAAGDRFGFALCGLGDIDGDGRSDYAVGADQDGVGSGYVRVYSGASGALVRTHVGTTPLGRFGAALAGLGDVDGDGRGDLAIGVPRELDGTGERTGAARVWSGADGELLWGLWGESHGAEFGHALAGGADLDGDGRGDLLASAPLQGGCGKVSAHSGADGAPLREFLGQAGGDRFGHALSWIDDLDGDSLPDLAVGAPREDPNGTDSGAVRVLSGDGEGCLLVTYCTAKANSQGCAPQIGWSGSPTLSAPDDFVVRATSVVNQKPGVMLWGPSQAAFPFQNGWLCVGPPIVRSALLSSGGNAPPDDCSGVLSLALTQALMLQQGWAAGTHVFAQFWSRDPLHPDGSATSLSDALHFQVCP